MDNCTSLDSAGKEGSTSLNLAAEEGHV